MESQRVGHDLVTEQQPCSCTTWGPVVILRLPLSTDLILILVLSSQLLKWTSNCPSHLPLTPLQPFLYTQPEGVSFLKHYWVAQRWRIHLPMQETEETQVWYLGQEDPLEEEMVTHSSILFFFFFFHSSILAWKNSMVRGAWQATVHRVTKIQTQLSDWTQAQTHILHPSLSS